MKPLKFQQVQDAINAITTDWSIRGPFHEDDGKYYALLHGEWVGDGYLNKRLALDAIYAALREGPAMTDITELALLVSKAKASVFTLEYISQFEPADIDSDDVDFRFEVDGRDTGTNVSIVDECGQAAKVIGALVEALEKSESRLHEVAVACATAEQALEKAQTENTAGVAGMAESYETTISMLRSRIAELESRTVKLPPLNDDLIAILGRPNFMCAHLAELLRKSGEDIKRKAEHEQAAIIHWFLGIYLEHGDKWEGVAKSDIQARVAGIKWEAE